MVVGELIPLALSFFGALFGSWALLMPFFEQTPAENGAAESNREQLRSLLLRKDSALTSLAEIEEDHRSGKITDADYALSRDEFMVEATSIEAELETTEPRRGGR